MDHDNYINLLIGIDDTDNANSRGTGFLARQLAHKLEATNMGKVSGITRHQLFVDPAIRYTSQNSSACINLMCSNVNAVTDLCADHLTAYSAPGSDAGLCVASFDGVNEQIIDWGLAAKIKVLNMYNATALAKQTNIYLKGFTGNHEGIIGALAAVGLRASGNDGRFIWRRGIKELRDMKAGVFSIREIKEVLALDNISSLDGEHPLEDAKDINT